MGNNKRKGKILCKIWFEESELKMLKQAIDSNMDCLAGSIIQKIDARGDFE